MSDVLAVGIVEQVKALLVGVGIPAYELDEAREKAADSVLENRYVELHLAPNGHGATLLHGFSDLDGYALGVRSCATAIYNVHATRRVVRDLLYAVPLMVDGRPSTPPQHDPGDPAEQDDAGYWTAYDEFTFTFD